MRNDWYDPTTWELDFGSDVRGEFFVYGDDLHRAGIFFAHPADPSRTDLTHPGWCVSAINFENIDNRPQWTVECWEPLTLSPSILCRSDQFHGFIREGLWVAA